MAIVVKDRVKVVSTTTGTSDFALGSASLGFQNFSVIGNGNETYYTAVDTVTGDFEVGIGTFTTAGPTLTRTTVLESSNAGAKVSFSAGSKDVFVTYPAERSVYLDTAGAYPVQNTFNTLNATTATLTGGTVSTTPSTGNDIANKTYVDTIASAGIHYHEPVFVESPNTAGSLNATYNQPGGAGVGVGATLTNAGTRVALTIDGVLMTAGKRVLIYNQTSAFQNGVYTVTTVGTSATNWVLTRATDADTYAPSSPNSLGQGDAFFVTDGDTGTSEGYVCTTVGAITFGTTAITFSQFSASTSYKAGVGLNLSPATTFNISAVGTAGTYGSASTVPVITTNAQGQVSGVTPTSIAITSAAVSGLAASATTNTTNAVNITSGTLPTGRISGSYTGITGTGALAAGSLAAGFTTVSAPLGGTGQSSYAVGDLLFSNTTTSLAKLADVAVGNALISGGVGSAPSYGKIGMATHVSGTLPVANGGTGVTSSTGTGSVVLSSSPTLVTPALGTPSALVGTNITGTAAGLTAGRVTTNANLTGPITSIGNATSVASQTGTGSTFVMNTSPTLITPVLGTPTSGTLTNGTGLPLTTGVTGTLPIANGGTAATTAAAALTSLGAYPASNPSGYTTNTGTVTSVAGTGTVNGISLSGTVTTSGNLTLGGTLSGVSLTTQVSNTLPVANGGTGITSLGAGVATFLNTPSSANLAAAVTDETGSGALVFATSPTFVTPALGTPTSGNLASCTFPTLNQNTTGSAGTLTTGRTIAITGDLTYTSGSFNGSANVTGTGTLANSGVVAGAYGANNSIPSITVDAKGRVTAASTVTPSGTYAISVSGSSASTTGNAATATVLQTARTIGGVSFNGSANINLPGVNTAGNQATTGSAATLTTARTINGVSFNGSANITVADATKLPLAGGTATGIINAPTFNATSTVGGGFQGIDVDTALAPSFTWTADLNTGMYLDAADTLGFTTGGVSRVTINATALTAAGNVVANSDERLKADWADLPEDFIERLTQVKHGTYTRIDSGERQAGSSAQDWQALLPEVVVTGTDEAKTLSLAYGNAALVSAVQLAKRVVELEARIARLELLLG